MLGGTIAKHRIRLDTRCGALLRVVHIILPFRSQFSHLGRPLQFAQRLSTFVRGSIDRGGSALCNNLQAVGKVKAALWEITQLPSKGNRY